jgi:hypothetical protein
MHACMHACMLHCTASQHSTAQRPLLPILPALPRLRHRVSAWLRCAVQVRLGLERNREEMQRQVGAGRGLHAAACHVHVHAHALQFELLKQNVLALGLRLSHADTFVQCQKVYGRSRGNTS